MIRRPIHPFYDSLAANGVEAGKLKHGHKIKSFSLIMKQYRQKILVSYGQIDGCQYGIPCVGEIEILNLND